MLKDLKERIGKLAFQKRPKIIIGLYQKRHTKSIAESVQRAQKEVADVIVVGQAMEGVYKSIEVGPDMKEIHAKMIEIISSGEIDGIVRGNVEEHGLLYGVKDALGMKMDANDLRIQNPGIIEDVNGNVFVLGPTSTVWGRENREKILWTDSAIKMLSWFGYHNPKLGFLTSTRRSNYKRPSIDETNKNLKWSYQTWESAEYLVDKYSQEGFLAKNYEINVEHAVADACDIICVAEGPIGNGIFRGAVLLGGAKLIAAPRIAISIPYEDTSQSEQDYYAHFLFVAAMVNGHLNNKKEN